MGADLGIAEMVRGAALACANAGPHKFDLLLVTAEPEETRRAAEAELDMAAAKAGCSYKIVHAAQQLPKDIHSPVEAYKKFPECSIRVAMDKAKALERSAVISPGTTGLVMTAGMFTLGRVRGIARAPIGTPMPTRGKQLFFVDGGSNVDCTPQQLYQFAVLAHLYIKNTASIERPTIALLSNGTEEYKGNTRVREAYELLKADSDLNFVGYTEGHTIFEGNLDIMVCDGFIGNILLKFAEGAGLMIVDMLKEEIKKSFIAKVAARLFQAGPFRRFAQRLDYTKIGGAPLLGLNGNVIICHGRGNARAIASALKVGHKMAAQDISRQVAGYIEEHGVSAEPGERGGNRRKQADGRRLEDGLHHKQAKPVSTPDG
jgi:glycerol-3-phosphate acyltransferase PlsX